MKVRGVALCSALVAAAWLVAACGPTCEQIAAGLPTSRPVREPATTPHARVYVPYLMANQLLNGTLAQLPPAPLPTALGPLEPVVTSLIGRFEVAAVNVKLYAESRDAITVAVTLELRVGGKGLLSMLVMARLTPELRRDEQGQWLHLGFGADNIVSVRPLLPPKAAQQLAELIYRLLPEHIRMTTPKIMVAAMAGKIVGDLGDKAYALLRGSLLTQLGEVTSVRVLLPDLPIAAFRVHSQADQGRGFAVDLFTNLPVRSGLPPEPGAEQARDAVTVRLAGSTVAELGNWAMARQLLPATYDRHLEAQPDGDYRLLLDWQAAEQRPFKVHVFRTQGRCSHVRVGARPVLQLAGPDLDFRLEDRERELVRGSAIVRLWVWLRAALVDTAARSRQLTADTIIEVGSQIVESHVTEARFDDAGLVLQVQLRLVEPGSAE